MQLGAPGVSGVPARGSLPRLLYVGDQPVESTVAGPAQLYKLLEDYPADRLRIVESNVAVSRPERRLPGVVYETVFAGFRRLQHTRFRPQACSLTYLTSSARWRLYARTIRSFQPQAVLSITHGSAWVTAATIARRCGLPLHLILHDDVFPMTGVEERWRKHVEAEFAEVYRQATTRLCIGPVMEAHYRRLYGVPGLVLYPTRSSFGVEFAGPRTPVGRSLVFAYAGSIHHGGMDGDLAVVARVLESRGHTLLLHSPSCVGETALPGLDRPNVIARPPIPGADWLVKLAAQADVLVLTMAFGYGRFTQLSFPSKLSDYTATKLPILLRAPPDSSAVRWAMEHRGVAEIVETQDEERLRTAILRLEDAAVRRSLGEAAAVAGDACFSRDAVIRRFHDALTSTGQ